MQASVDATAATRYSGLCIACPPCTCRKPEWGTTWTNDPRKHCCDDAIRRASRPKYKLLINTDGRGRRSIYVAMGVIQV